jgi:hypothetical protein
MKKPKSRHLHLLSLRLFGNSEFQALGRIDLIHGLLHTYIRVNVRDECLENLVSVFAHCFLKGVLDRKSKFFLCFEDGVKLQSRELTSHDIIYVGSDLLLRIGEGVKCIIHLFSYYLILNAHDCVEEDVVLCFCFNADIQLLNT